MTINEIKALLASTDLPVVYYAWPVGDVPALPYLVYLFPNSDNFGADDLVYKQVEALNVELYTSQKDPAAEAQVEAVLNGAGIFWDKSEAYIDSEHMQQVVYEMEVIIDDGNT